VSFNAGYPAIRSDQANEVSQRPCWKVELRSSRLQSDVIKTLVVRHRCRTKNGWEAADSSDPKDTYSPSQGRR
jgi:hypothetical protein